MQIAMEGRDAANNWENQARSLNERTETTLKEVSNLLTSVRNFSEGTLVDEIYDVGDRLVTATTNLMQGMNKIFDVVKNLLSFFTNLFSEASQAQSDTKSYL